MANALISVRENVPGEFFVDTTCIDCDTCRQIAPAVFGETGEFAYVRQQPHSAAERRQALRALVSCPTGSIGCRGRADAKAALADFPLLVEEPVYYCGFASPKSYGGSSYFIEHPHGNWLIDSPKFVPQLVKEFERRGGIAHIFLTHQDDVADAEQFAVRFGSRRIIHHHERAAQPTAELILEGDEPISLAPDFLAIPTPGHTAGHLCLLFQDKFLFTGDHLAWDRDAQQLTAFRDYCWDSWRKQTASMARLTDEQFTFTWILPGHGQRVQLPAAEMRREIEELVERMTAE